MDNDERREHALRCCDERHADKKSPRTGPAQSASQRCLGAHACGPTSPSSYCGRLLVEAGSPLQDRMDDECALRYACSLAVKRGVYQVRTRLKFERATPCHAPALIASRFPRPSFPVHVSSPQIEFAMPVRRVKPLIFLSFGAVQLDWIGEHRPGARQREDLCSYTEDGILKPQRLVSRYSCLTRNNACLNLSTLDDQA